MAYATIGEADTYLLTVTAWAEATAAQKARALDSATYALDGAVYWDDGDAPTEAEAIAAARDACCELAVYDLDGSLWPVLNQPVVQSEQIGDLKRTYRDSGSSGRGHLFSRFPKVAAMLGAYVTTKTHPAGGDTLLLRA